MKRMLIAVVLGLCLLGQAGCKDSGYHKGDAVEVEWKGSWWKGEVLEAKPDGTIRIHYVGWASSWDENVPAARLRAPTGQAQVGPNK